MSRSYGIHRKRRTRTLSVVKNAFPLTYSSWKGTMNRPLSDAHYQDIEVCERWWDFEKFLCDMGQRPSKIYHLARRDHSKGYFLENCLWQTASENSSESRARNENKINSLENRALRSLQMTGVTIWKCNCGARCYRNQCRKCGGTRSEIFGG